MKNWFFTVTDRYVENELGREYFTAKEVYCRWMRAHFWGITPGLANVHQIAHGDQVVFYIAGQKYKEENRTHELKYFAGICELQTDFMLVDDPVEVEQFRLGPFDPHIEGRHGVKLSNIQLFTNRVQLNVAKDRLPMFQHVKNIGWFFRGSIHPITAEDFSILVDLGKPGPILHNEHQRGAERR